MAEPEEARVTTDLFLKAADRLTERLEQASRASEKETDAIRRGIDSDVKGISSRAVAGMKTGRAGRKRIVVPTSENKKRVSRASSQTQERFSRFRVKWLDKGAVRRHITEGFTKADQATFFRHSNRLARNSKDFLRRLGELEPSLQDEIDATIAMIDDARNDLLKLEVRSFTQVDENLRRSLTARQGRSVVEESIQTFDLNRNLWNLSLLEHPRGVTRSLLDQAAERMASRITPRGGNPRDRGHVFVAAAPDIVGKMTKGSRTGQVLWRVFALSELDRRFGARAGDRKSLTTHQDLGLGFGTKEWYIPIPPENVDEVREAMRERRQDFLARQEERPE